MRIAFGRWTIIQVLILAALWPVGGCSDDDGSASTSAPSANIYSPANGCYAVESSSGFLGREAETGYGFSASAQTATPFFMKPSALGTYLLYDSDAGYLVSDGSMLRRVSELDSDVTTLIDGYQSNGEWDLQVSDRDRSRFRLRHRKSGLYLTRAGLGDVAQAAAIALQPRAGCAEFPEEKTYTEGRVKVTKFDDGAVFGFADAHSHILANFGFGGWGIFHGAPFHPLGVKHALPDCQKFHGSEGRKDLFGYGYDSNSSNVDLSLLVETLLRGRLPQFNHHTAGYPDFTEWPSGPFSSTHQVQYYKWLERAYLGGLRLVVQDAVSNQIICDLLGNGRIQPIRYSCNDMTAVERQLDEVYHMQDYIDAQEGGPGNGWFRIVTTPQAAREVILAGKMAVVLGIETSNVLDCPLTPPDGGPRCNEDSVRQRLEHVYERGVRAMFPVHKYDNAFSAGDGHKGFIELGNMIQTSNFSNFTTDCDESFAGGFDSGAMSFPGINMPRADYFAAPPLDLSHFYDNIIFTLGPLLDRLMQGPIPGEHLHCQAAGLTPLGEFLMQQMMSKGMIIEVDHMPRRSYKRAYEILEANDYPAAGTHGRDYNGRLYALGGISTSGFSNCRSATQAATVDDGFQSRLDTIRANGGYPGLGFGLDLNGFAGATGPRFGSRSGCGVPQTDPLSYPFTSYAGDVTFLQPKVGNRTLDFNTEGLVHIGLLPDQIEDVRRDGLSKKDLDPLFRSAEAYIRMWEKAEKRAAELRAR